jgi:hypothetical protein
VTALTGLTLFKLPKTSSLFVGYGRDLYLGIMFSQNNDAKSIINYSFFLFPFEKVFQLLRAKNIRTKLQDELLIFYIIENTNII